MGFQFVHLETYSRKADRSGRSIKFVLSEARRDPEASIHVPKPTPPVVIFGLDIGEVERIHEVQVDNARITPRDGKPRRVRQDQHTLATLVMSHPYTVNEVTEAADKRLEVQRWEARNVAWLRTQFGESLISVIRHEDEAHWHLHAYALPNNSEMKASALHPGRQAKDKVMAAGVQTGEDEKALNRRGDRAYRAAMRAWQDDYHRQVAEPCGLTRLGPGRRRLTRSQWQAEKAAARCIVSTMKRAAEVKEKAHFIVRDAKSAAEAAKQRAASAAEKERLHLQISRRTALEVHTARKELQSVRRSTERLRGIGGLLRAFFDGFHKSRLRSAIASQWSDRIETFQAMLDATRRDLQHERDRRHAAEQRAVAAVESVLDVAAQRDRAWKEIRQLRQAIGKYVPEFKTLKQEYKP